MRVRLKGINSRRKTLADGSVRIYYWAWKGGPPLRGEPGTPEFIASYNEACATKIAPPTGVLQALLFRFQESAEFQYGIEERTRRDYIKQIKRIEQAFGDFPIKAISDPRATSIFLEWRDKLAQTSLRQADYAFGTLSRVLSWALKRRLITTNPCGQGAWGKAAMRAGIRGLTFHDLRGTAVVTLARAGCNEVEIYSITGHKPGDVQAILTAHYLPRDAEVAGNAIAKLNRYKVRGDQKEDENLPTTLPTALKTANRKKEKA
jgi:hypothetical protein